MRRNDRNCRSFQISTNVMSLFKPTTTSSRLISSPASGTQLEKINKKTTNKEKDEESLCNMKVILSYVMFFTIGPSLIFTNKYVLTYIEFKFPIMLSSLGVLTSSIVVHLFVYLKIITIRDEIRELVTWKFLLRNNAMISLLHALTLNFGNTVYYYLPVSFIQMLKSFTPVVTMILLFLTKQENISDHTLVISIILISIGTLITSFGINSQDATIIGFIYMIGAEGTEALKVTLNQKLLQGVSLPKHYNNNNKSKQTSSLNNLNANGNACGNRSSHSSTSNSDGEKSVSQNLEAIATNSEIKMVKIGVKLQNQNENKNKNTNTNTNNNESIDCTLNVTISNNNTNNGSGHNPGAILTNIDAETSQAGYSSDDDDDETRSFLIARGTTSNTDDGNDNDNDNNDRNKSGGNEEKFKFSVFEGLYYYAPLTFVFMCLLALPTEMSQFLQNRQENINLILNNWYFFLFAAILGFGVNFTTFFVTKVIGALYLKALGTFRSICLVGLSAFVFSETITLQELIGYVVSLIGFALYNYVKLRR